MKGYLTAVPFGLLLGAALYLLAPLLKPPVATITSTPTETRGPAAMAESLIVEDTQQTPSPSATIETTATPTKRIAAPGCIFWDEVSVQQVGQEICVQGEFLRMFEREDGTFVMIFSESPGTFQLWSASKPFELFIEGIPGKCVLARGWVMTSGVRPMIVLRKHDKLEACP